MTETVAQQRLRANRSREARAERAALDAAHTAEYEAQLKLAEEIAAEVNPDAPRPDWSDPTVSDPSTRPVDTRQLRVTRGSSVVTKRIDWLVEHWIPRGSLTLLAGREGLGKSTIACWWSAWLTRQGKTVVYVHTEDSREHTVVPRLKAAGADLDKVLFIDVATETTETGTVVLPLDNQRLEDLVVVERVEFIVLDAATSAMASQLSGKDDRQVRQFLEPLAQLAARQDIVILGLVHFGKRDGADTGKLILGSIAWSQVARSVLSVAHDADQDHLVVTNTKGNLATKVLSKACRVVSQLVQLDDGPAEVGVIDWLGEVDTDARDVLAGDEQRDESASASVDVAVDWLRDYLEAEGPHILSAEVKRRSKAADISERTLQRARKKLGVVVTYTDEKPSRSQWSLPSMGAVVVDGEVVPTPSRAPERGTTSKLGTTPGQEDMPGSEVPAYPQDKGGCANPEFMAQPQAQPGADSAVIGQWKGSGKAVTAALQVVPDPDTPRTCRQWFDARIRELIDGGETTAVSRDVYSEGTAAGWSIDNLRQAARKSTLVAVAEKHSDGSTTWELGEGVESTHVPCSVWIVAFLRERGGWVPSTEAYAAGKAAGYGRDSVKSASLATHVLKRGQSVLTEWSLDPSYQAESA